MGEEGNASIFNFSYTSFLLVGFPGLREWRPLLVLPLSFLYMSIISANALVIHTVVAQRSLHQPMYVLIAILLAVNVCTSTAVMPKMLEGFVRYANPITLRGCLVQMFFTYFTLLLDYNLLLAMALDRYVAICHPLRYSELMTSHLLGLTFAAFALTRSLGVAVSSVVLTATARFCRTSVIQHFTCEYIALLNIACGDLTFNNRLGLAMRLVTVTFDLTLLGTSYTRIIYAAFRISSGGARAKALHTCGSHLLVILTIYLSGLSSSIVFRVAKTVSQDVQNLLSAIYLLLPGALNPLIYGMRTKEIRQHIEKMLCGKQSPQDIREKSENMREERELPG
ncbi:LOW QUALITY PROTEIN: olfactory receptor 52E8-like [Alexandromys fortis]|uniref:LOW QUALITY PROTEIN: olfactory receptor 52E8-like n=1 Tax=Alexandromys fortis TaxID=100897 RepID=UPI0021532B0B|nr:LOW QUALITY PROTEIN: olfactory receptor 52E8-like [Microtus fortis]